MMNRKEMNTLVEDWMEDLNHFLNDNDKIIKENYDDPEFWNRMDRILMTALGFTINERILVYAFFSKCTFEIEDGVCDYIWTPYTDEVQESFSRLYSKRGKFGKLKNSIKLEKLEWSESSDGERTYIPVFHR